MNEYCSGFENIGHNSLIDLLFLWIIPNGAWLILPSYMIYVSGSEIMQGLTIVAGGGTVSSDNTSLIKTDWTGCYDGVVSDTGVRERALSWSIFSWKAGVGWDFNCGWWSLDAFEDSDYPSYLVWKDIHLINAGPGGQGV
jgi:hypothetical protein